MPLGPKRRWNNSPRFDNNVQQDWAAWVTNSLQDSQGTVTPPDPPKVTTVSHPGAVQIIWNEVNQATSYAVYETSTPMQPPGIPITTVVANMAAQANGVMRFNLNDTVVRYYSVMTITQYRRSALSVPAPGAALPVGDPVIPVSDTAVNQNAIGGGVGGGGGIWGTNPGPLY